MSNHAIFPKLLQENESQRDQYVMDTVTTLDGESSQTLPASITKAASKQTYYTIRFLVDRDRILDAYRAYAYFRWVDDWLDQIESERSERMAFVERQQALIDCGLHNKWPSNMTDEEHMLKDLLRKDSDPNSGLQSYIQNMMMVMAFDADRRGQTISSRELDEYTLHLSTAVTDAMHYFIGHNQPAPQDEARYLAVTAAHITHMLRDTFEDVAAGYFNIPCEFLASQKINPCDIESDPYREWVKSRVQLARTHFKAGERYLAQIKCTRCRIAGYAYMARFKGTLDAIEREGYRIRPEYPERKNLKSCLRMGWSLFDALGITHTKRSN
jgi:Squalene/phytoene synthase